MGAEMVDQNRRRLSRSGRILLVSGCLSLTAVALGAWVCAASGVPAAVWVRNLAAWFVGGLAAYLLGRWGGGWLFPALLAAAALLLASTLVSEGQLGVHRWVQAGPLAMNVAMLVLPAALVAMAALSRNSPWSWLLALACMAMLVMQPDASQATAFGVGLIAVALGNGIKKPANLAVASACAALAAVSWTRPDPLAPVPEVELILHMAYALSPVLAVLAFAALIFFSLAPGGLVKGGARDEELAGRALSLYLLTSAIMPFLGAFPVPLVGVGISPVLGAWLGLGALAALSRARATSKLTIEPSTKLSRPGA
jgi:cell division protein FtsW (lipid II flippase)